MFNYQFPIDDITSDPIYSYADISEAFHYISFKAQLEFDFPQGGCQQRSHLISLILSKRYQIIHSKIWLFSPAALFDYDQRTLFITDKNELAPNNIVNWNFHTAPMVQVEINGVIQKVVIDPSLHRYEPLLLPDWLARIGNSQISKYTFLRPEKYFFNCKYNENCQLTNVFGGSFFEFVNPARDNLVLEKGLAVNDMAMAIYKRYIKPHIYPWVAKNDAQLADLKEIFGNATALDLIFCQNISGYTDNTSYRYVMTHYGDIVKEGKQIFDERLLFWTRVTNELLKA